MSDPFATEGNHAGGYIVHEQHIQYCRENIRLASGNNLGAGTVLGQITNAVNMTVEGDNTGDGTPGAATLGTAAVNGTYVLTCTAESADAGTFSVVDPNGVALADLTVAVAYVSDHINMTVPDGAADWDIGDIIYYDVIKGEYAVFDQDESDGTEVAAAILFDAVDASSAEQNAVATVRATVVNAAEIVWPSDITEVEKAIAIGQLRTKTIIVSE